MQMRCALTLKRGCAHQGLVRPRGTTPDTRSPARIHSAVTRERDYPPLPAHTLQKTLFTRYSAAEMACERIFALFLALVVCIATIEAGALTRKRSAGWNDNEILPEKRGDNDYTNHLLMALIDAVIADAEVRGANQDQLGELMRKRSGIRKCFFHAVNCW